jgi:hypothetical protein
MLPGEGEVLDSAMRVLVIGFVVLWMAVTAFFVLRTAWFLMMLLLAGSRQLLDSISRWRAEVPARDEILTYRPRSEGMKSKGLKFSALATLLLWACGGEGTQREGARERDLSLAPAESIAPLGDVPVEQPQQSQPPRLQGRSSGEAPRQAPAGRSQSEAPAAERSAPATQPAPLSLAEGTVIELWAADTLTSRHNKKGDEVRAVLPAALKDSRGREVIPEGAIFVGTIADIAPAESPGGEGRIVLSFDRVEFGGKTYSVAARVEDLGTYMKGRGITAGDAAKVGAGAVVGGVAGRIIGRDAKGAVIGAAAGAAAGAGIAAATRDIDIILPAGALVKLVLTAPFVREAGS